MNSVAVNNKIDNVIRALLCVAIFFLPYSKAIVETSVVTSCLLWIIKHTLIFIDIRAQKNPSSNFVLDLGRAFCPAANPINKMIALFLLICMLSVVRSSIPLQSLHGFFTKTIEWFAIYLLVIEVFVTRRQIEVVIFVFIITASLTGLDTLIQYYWTHKDIFRHRALVEGYRATGGFLHPNVLGAFLSIAIPVVLGFLAMDKKRKLLWVAVGSVLVWALFLTFSRGAWMGTAVGILFFILIVVARHANPWLRRAMVIFALIISSLLISQSFELRKKANVGKNDEVTAEWRISLWREAWVLVKQRPLLGHGLNTFMPVMEHHLIETQNPLASKSSPSYAHNCYLQMAVEIGIPGLVVFCVMLVMLFRKVLSSIPHADKTRYFAAGLLSAMLAFLVHSAVDIDFYSLELPILFWFMAGVVISLDKQLSDKTSYAIK